jgi:hypothetical protein
LTGGNCLNQGSRSISTSVTANAAFDFSCGFARSEIGTQQLLIRKGISAPNFQFTLIFLNTNFLRLSVYPTGAAASLTIYDITTVADTLPHTVRMTYDGANICRIWLDGALVFTRAIGPLYASAEAYLLSNPTATGRIKKWGCVLETNGARYHWPFAEGSGTTFYDAGAAANHITFDGVGTYDWATQDAYHYNITHGFRLSSGVKIPAKLDGSAAANGSAITNFRSAGHNGAESVVNFDYPGLTTWAHGATLPAGVSADIVNNVYFNLRHAL